MELNRREILRYLGYGNQEADERINALIEETVQELFVAAAPKSINKVFDVKLNADDFVELTCFRVKSKNLAKNLQNCRKVILFAATLGAGVDRLARKCSQVQMSKALVLQAAATTFLEEYCDRINEEISKTWESEGYFSRPRFSPGYGDFPLKHQRDIIGILESPKKIGLTLTDQLIMIPSKSVTAVIGLSKENQNCHKSGCEVCEKINCIYKRG